MEEKKQKDFYEMKAKVSSKVAYAVGGIVGGAAVGFSESSRAANPSIFAAGSGSEDSELPIVENVEIISGTSETIGEVEIVEDSTIVTQNEPIASTGENVPEQTSEISSSELVEEIGLTDNNRDVPVAHVNDELSFAEAFAEARSQVGSGGVFEWRGSVYNTYIESEWDNMSSTQKNEFLSKVDYKEILEDSIDLSISPNEVAEVVPQGNVSSNVEDVGNQAVSGGLNVYAVETVTDEYGNEITIAAVEIEGDQVLLVDGDNDGIIDVAVCDENHDGEIEVIDISDGQMPIDELQQMAAFQNNEGLYACNDDLPDYMNDADVSSMV